MAPSGLLSNLSDHSNIVTLVLTSVAILFLFSPRYSGFWFDDWFFCYWNLSVIITYSEILCLNFTFKVYLALLKQESEGSRHYCRLKVEVPCFRARTLPQMPIPPLPSISVPSGFQFVSRLLYFTSSSLIMAWERSRGWRNALRPCTSMRYQEDTPNWEILLKGLWS